MSNTQGEAKINRRIAEVSALAESKMGRTRPSLLCLGSYFIPEDLYITAQGLSGEAINISIAPKRKLVRLSRWLFSDPSS